MGEEGYKILNIYAELQRWEEGYKILNIYGSRRQKIKKLAWVTKSDPRLPAKGSPRLPAKGYPRLPAKGYPRLPAGY